MQNEPIAPLISSSVAGPSGIMHLPRLWSKILLHATGRLPSDYRHGAGGFDEALCTHFGVDREAFVAFVETEKPDYRTAELRFLANADATPERIAAFNAYVIERQMPDAALARRRRERFDIPGDQHTNAVSLNDLDDWSVFHELLTGSS